MCLTLCKLLAKRKKQEYLGIELENVVMLRHRKLVKCVKNLFLFAFAKTKYFK